MIKFAHFQPKYITPINHLYKKYINCLEDDYNEDTLAGIINRTHPFFWVILSDTSFAGFVYLDNIIGNSKKLHSAEVNTCLLPEFWGDFTKFGSKIFLQKCFDELGFIKIKALIYPWNHRVKNLLKECGFEYEATLKSETMHNNNMQDIEIHSLFNKGDKNEARNTRSYR